MSRQIILNSIIAMSAGIVIYGLWYIHNDYPFAAAMLGGLVYMIQVHPIAKMINRLEHRIDENEMRISEMETEKEDDYPWGV